MPSNISVTRGSLLFRLLACVVCALGMLRCGVNENAGTVLKLTLPDSLSADKGV